MDNHDDGHRSAESALAGIPPAPRPLTKRARALVTGYGGGQQASLVIALAFIVVGSVITVAFGWGGPVDLAISRHPVPSLAEVLEARLNRSVKINGRRPTTIRFAYVIGGKRFEGRTDVLDEDLIARAQPGTRLPIEVAAARPDWARLQGSRYAAFGYASLLLAVFPVIGLLLLVATIRSNRREVRAYRDGSPVLAKVVYAGPDRSTKIGGKHPFLLRWEFDCEGERCEGSLSSMDTKALQAVIRAEAVPVLYLPENPRINTLYVD